MRYSPAGTCPDVSACRSRWNAGRRAGRRTRCRRPDRNRGRFRCGAGHGAACRAPHLRSRSCEEHVGPPEALAILGAGIVAGALNAVVGSGSLITFPTLLAFGFPPVVANVSNNVGLVPGNFSGAFGYRRELAGQRARLTRLAVLAAAGSIA